MKRTLLQITAVLIGLLVPSAASARPGERIRVRDSVNMELLGRGFLFSFNAEYGLDENLALGAGILPFLSSREKTFVVPLNISWLSNSNRGLYAGAGVTVVSHDGGNTATPNFTLGVQAPMGRSYLRLTLTWFQGVRPGSDGAWRMPQPWPGLAFGGRF